MLLQAMEAICVFIAVKCVYRYGYYLLWKRIKKVTPSEVKESLAFYLQEMTLGIERLQSLDGVASHEAEKCNHFINELVVALDGNQIAAAGNDDNEDAESTGINEEEETSLSIPTSLGSHGSVAIDIVDSTIIPRIASNKIVPITTAPTTTVSPPSNTIPTRNSVAPVKNDDVNAGSHAIRAAERVVDKNGVNKTVSSYSNKDFYKVSDDEDDDNVVEESGTQKDIVEGSSNTPIKPIPTYFHDVDIYDISDSDDDNVVAKK